MGYFYWLRVKSSNHLHTELNLGYLKGTKFCLESKYSEYSEFKVSGQENYKQPYKVIYPNLFTMALFTA